MGAYQLWEPNHFVPVFDVRTADIVMDSEPSDLDDDDHATVTALTSLLDEGGSDTSHSHLRKDRRLS